MTDTLVQVGLMEGVTEALRQRFLVCRFNSLPAKENNLVLDQCFADLGEQFITDRLAQVDACDLGTQGLRERCDFQHSSKPLPMIGEAYIAQRGVVNLKPMYFAACEAMYTAGFGTILV